MKDQNREAVKQSRPVAKQRRTHVNQSLSTRGNTKTSVAGRREAVRQSPGRK